MKNLLIVLVVVLTTAAAAHADGCSLGSPQTVKKFNALKAKGVDPKDIEGKYMYVYELAEVQASLFKCEGSTEEIRGWKTFMYDDLNAQITNRVYYFAAWLPDGHFHTEITTAQSDFRQFMGDRTPTSGMISRWLESRHQLDKFKAWDIQYVNSQTAELNGKGEFLAQKIVLK